MKTQRLVTDVTPDRPPDRAERDILGMVLDVFWQIQAVFVISEPLYDAGTLS